MSRRQSKGDYHGGNTIVRFGNYGFGRLDDDLGESNSKPVITPLMAASQKKSDRLRAKVAKRRAKRHANHQALTLNNAKKP